MERRHTKLSVPPAMCVQIVKCEYRDIDRLKSNINLCFSRGGGGGVGLA